MKTYKPKSIKTNQLSSKLLPKSVYVPPKQVKPKVCILIPLDDMIPAEFFMSYNSLIINAMQYFTVQTFTNDQKPCDKARNRLVEKALEANPDYIVFLDADQEFPSDVILQLVMAQIKSQAELVSGLYFEKKKPYYPVIREYKFNGYFKVDDLPMGKVVDIGGCGMGCVLIKPNVFKKIKYPYFAYSYEKQGFKDIQLSEDLYFCRQLKRLGLKMVCDTKIVCSHIGSTVDVLDFLTFAPELRKSAQIERDLVIKQLAISTGHSEEDITYKVMSGIDLMNREINSDIDYPYMRKHTTFPIYAEVEKHYVKERQPDFTLICELINSIKPKNILHYWSGIGAISLELASAGFDVTLAEYDCPMQRFAEVRAKSNLINFKRWNLGNSDLPPDKEYDVIIFQNVIEYLTNKQALETMTKLAKLKSKNCIVIMSQDFDNPNAILKPDMDIQLAIFNFLNKEFPEGNINTKEHWESVWEKDKYENTRTYPLLFNSIISGLQSMNKDGKLDLLDVGCGVGKLLRRIKKEVAGFNLTGIDISNTAINTLIEQEPEIRGIQGSYVEKLMPQNYDVILMTEFLEHFSDNDIGSILRKTQNILRETGIFICSVPNNHAPKIVCLEHEQVFSKEKMRVLLDKYFKIVTITEVNCEQSHLLAICK